MNKLLLLLLLLLYCNDPLPRVERNKGNIKSSGGTA